MSFHPNLAKDSALAEYENFKRITMPIDNNHLLLVTADNQDDPPKIVKYIQNVLEKENHYETN